MIDFNRVSEVELSALSLIEGATNWKLLMMVKAPEPVGGDHRHHQFSGVQTRSTIKR